VAMARVCFQLKSSSIQLLARRRKGRMIKSAEFFSITNY